MKDSKDKQLVICPIAKECQNEDDSCYHAKPHKFSENFEGGCLRENIYQCSACIPVNKPKETWQEKRDKIPFEKRCRTCYGRGKHKPYRTAKMVVCSICKGTGYRPKKKKKYEIIGIDEGSPDGDCTIKAHKEGDTIIVDEVIYSKPKEKYKIIKKKGRWGITHYEIEGLNKGDYQKAGNKTFDSYKDAENYLKIFIKPKQEEEQECPECKGLKTFPRTKEGGNTDSWLLCPTCKGTGLKPKTKEKKCPSSSCCENYSVKNKICHECKKICAMFKMKEKKEKRSKENVCAYCSGLEVNKNKTIPTPECRKYCENYKESVKPKPSQSEGVDDIFEEMQVSCMDETLCEYAYRKGVGGNGRCKECKAYIKAKSKLTALIRDKVLKEAGKKIEKRKLESCEDESRNYIFNEGLGKAIEAVKEMK